MTYIQTYTPPPIKKGDILRYAGVTGSAPQAEDLMVSCLDEVCPKLTYKVCYREFDIAFLNSGIDLGFCTVLSSSLEKNLNGCSGIVLFGATLGMDIDRLIARYSAVSPSRALMLQAVGAERIESLCDTFCDDIAAKKAAVGAVTRPRFSPGYGDFGIEIQKDIFAVLDCPRKIGLSLNQSLLMSPSKSVTALIGTAYKSTGSIK